LIFKLLTELLPSLKKKVPKYTRKCMDSQIIDIANYKTCPKSLIDVEQAFLIR
jgi:hypothetical protein